MPLIIVLHEISEHFSLRASNKWSWYLRSYLHSVLHGTLAVTMPHSLQLNKN